VTNQPRAGPGRGRTSAQRSSALEASHGRADIERPRSEHTAARISGALEARDTGARQRAPQTRGHGCASIGRPRREDTGARASGALEASARERGIGRALEARARECDI